MKENNIQNVLSMLSELTTKVRSISYARDSVGDFVNHMVTCVRIILLDKLLTTGTLLSAAGFFP